MKKHGVNFLSSLPRRNQRISGSSSKLGQRKGQFYIVTTIMIVAIIVGFASLSNVSRERSSLKFFYEGEELELEASKVIDYGISTTSDSARMIAVMDDFARDYITYSSADNFYFVFGVKNTINPISSNFRFFMYQKTDPTDVTLKFDDGEIETFTGVVGTITPLPPNSDFPHTTDWINLTIPDSEGNLTFDFNIKTGSNFYYVMTKEIGGDRYLETNA